MDQAFATGASGKEYGYATQDMPTCSCSSWSEETGTCNAHSGCDGGNLWTLWDLWMRRTARNLRRKDCSPLQIKCLAADGVVNPLSAQQCEYFSSLPVWDRPCA